jgi:chromosome segregation ATPase
VVDVVAVAEELYALTPGEFTGTRNAWAKQTKADGEPDTAMQIGALRKPSTAAWVVNAMMRRHSEQMGQVLDLGRSLRDAQESLDGEALRDLTRQRRQLTAAVTRQARAMATELGQRVTDDVARQIEETLHAAMVDEDAAAAVRSGLLVSAITATGMGDLEVGQVVAVPEAMGVTARARSTGASKRSPLTAVPEPPEARRADRRRDAERAVKQARAEMNRAEKQSQKAIARASQMQARVLQLREQLDEVRRREAELEHEIGQVEESSDRAAEETADVADAVEEARRALERAQAERDRLD